MVLPLVPQPSTVTVESGSLPLAPSARIVAVDGADAAASDLQQMLAARADLHLEVSDGAPRRGDIVLRAEVGRDESYRIEVTDRVEIAGSAAGLFYGIRTLAQLLAEDGGEWSVPLVSIADAPRYAYRGVMLDVARTFFDVATVKAFIDRASSLKFNHLHLHLTDDQGWRLHIDSRPLLTERAADGSVLGRPGGFYTKDDFREIVAYAAAHHMTVVPEIDLPGHTHAIGLAYPEVVEAPVMNDNLVAQSELLGQALPVAGQPYDGWGVGHSSVRIDADATWSFLRDVLTEVAEISPGPYLHIGGDEALGTPAVDFDRFIERVTALTTEIGKTPMAWHEAGSADIAKGTVGQFWGSDTPTTEHAEQTRRFAERGGRVVLSPSTRAYLDQKYDADFPVGLTWAAVIDLETAYTWEPEAIVPGLDAAAILGIEGPLWSETTSSLADIDLLFFPRAAALAEIGWSQASAKDWESFRDRVGALGARWDAAGWGGHRPAELAWDAR